MLSAAVKTPRRRYDEPVRSDPVPGPFETYENRQLAAVLERTAGLLDAQNASPQRVESYRRGAQAVRQSVRDLREIFATEGIAGIERLPGVGARLAATVRELLETGRSRFLDYLEGGACPEDFLCVVPGVGPVLAARLHHELGIDSLGDLETAANDGRLEALHGIGPRRAAAMLAALDSMPVGSRRFRASRIAAPVVGLLLDVDNEYRTRVDLGILKTIAPHRCNPKGEAWLPIMHLDRDDWEFTAMYSDSAHGDAGPVSHDRVVILYLRDEFDGQCTVLTETRGQLAGERVVRGREGECFEYYEATRRANVELEEEPLRPSMIQLTT